MFLLTISCGGKVFVFLDWIEYFWTFFLLEYSSFTVLYQFLLYIKMNQWYAYIDPFPLGMPSHLGQHRALCRGPCTFLSSHFLNNLNKFILTVWCLVCNIVMQYFYYTSVLMSHMHTCVPQILKPSHTFLPTIFLWVIPEHCLWLLCTIHVQTCMMIYLQKIFSFLYSTYENMGAGFPHEVWNLYHI